MPQDRNPKVGAEFNFRVGCTDWRETVINNLKAKKAAGATVAEIVQSSIGDLDEKNTLTINTRKRVLEILTELCEVGVVVKTGTVVKTSTRYRWWRHAK